MERVTEDCLVSDPFEALVFEALGCGSIRIDGWEIERLADDLLRRARRDTTEALAAAAGCRIRSTPGLAADLIGTVRDRNTVLVRSEDNPQRLRLTTRYGLAHWLLHVVAEYTSADIARLALAIAMPLPGLRRSQVADAPQYADLESSTQLPAWAIAARLAMPTVRAVGCEVIPSTA